MVGIYHTCKISNVDCTKHKPKLKSAQNQVFVGLKGLISPTITVKHEARRRSAAVAVVVADSMSLANGCAL